MGIRPGFPVQKQAARKQVTGLLTGCFLYEEKMKKSNSLLAFLLYSGDIKNDSGQILNEYEMLDFFMETKGCDDETLITALLPVKRGMGSVVPNRSCAWKEAEDPACESLPFRPSTAFDSSGTGLVRSPWPLGRKAAFPGPGFKSMTASGYGIEVSLIGSLHS